MLEKPARADTAAGGTTQKTTSYLSCGDVPKIVYLQKSIISVTPRGKKSSLYTLYKLFQSDMRAA